MEWAEGSGSLATISTLAAFSWCFFLEVELEIPANRPATDLVWITDVLTDVLELRIKGRDSYELSSFRPGTLDSGLMLIGTDGRPIRVQGVVVRHWAKGRYWCWPLPPDGPVTCSIAWSVADINEAVGTFFGESVKLGARRSLALDADMRHIRLQG